METIGTGTPAVEGARRLVLEVVGRFGPMAVNEIPRAWPLTRDHVSAVVRDLAESGAVALSWDPVVPGRRRVRITELGSVMLARGDVSESTVAAR